MSGGCQGARRSPSSCQGAHGSLITLLTTAPGHTHNHSLATLTVLVSPAWPCCTCPQSPAHYSQLTVSTMTLRKVWQAASWPAASGAWDRLTGLGCQDNASHSLSPSSGQAQALTVSLQKVVDSNGQAQGPSSGQVTSISQPLIHCHH